MVEHKAGGGVEDAGRLAGEGAAVAGDQPELRLPAGPRLQALGGAALAQQVGQGVEIDRVLQEHRPVGGDREIVQEGEAIEAVAALAQQGAAGRIELHKPHRAARPAVHAKRDHPLGAVVAGIEAGVGAEGLTRLEGPAQQGEAAGFEGFGIEGVGGAGLPEGQELIAQAHHVRVGDVLEPQVECVGQRAAGLLGAEHAPAHEASGLLLRQPTLGAHEAVAQLGGAAAIEAHGADHAVAIEGVVHPAAAALQPAGAVAVKGAAQLRRDRAAGGRQGHVVELDADVAEGAGPVGAVVAAGGGGGCWGGGGWGRSGGHQRRLGGRPRSEAMPPSSRNGV